MSPARSLDEEKIERRFRQYRRTVEKAYPRDLTAEEAALFRRLYFQYIEEIWDKLSCDDGCPTLFYKKTSPFGEV